MTRCPQSVPSHTSRNLVYSCFWQREERMVELIRRILVLSWKGAEHHELSQWVT